jgi:hypothetical protein
MNVDVDSLHTCDSDVAGRSTTLNYDYLNIDVDVSNPSCMCESIADHDGATLNNKFMNVDVDDPSGYESVRHLSPSSIQAGNSAAVALSHLFSTIQYANKSMLLNLIKHHNVQLPSKYITVENYSNRTSPN